MQSGSLGQMMDGKIEVDMPVNISVDRSASMPANMSVNIPANVSANVPANVPVNMSADMSSDCAGGIVFHRDMEQKWPAMPGSMAGMPIGMGYVPWQRWGQTYPLSQGFQRGTIFPELDLPFVMGRCRG